MKKRASSREIWIVLTMIALSAAWLDGLTKVDLYRNGLNPDEVPHLSQTLDELGFAHKLNAMGDGFMVTPDSVVPARVALARRGLPESIGELYRPDEDLETKTIKQRKAKIAIRVARSQKATLELEECLQQYPELASFKVNLVLRCRCCGYFLDEEHRCEYGEILVKERPGQNLDPIQLQGLLRMIALTDHEFYEVRVKRFGAGGEVLAEMGLNLGGYLDMLNDSLY